eukprot:5676380-Pleurochrysis_carterae.AAC.1
MVATMAFTAAAAVVVAVVAMPVVAMSVVTVAVVVLVLVLTAVLAVRRRRMSAKLADAAEAKRLAVAEAAAAE